MINTFPGITDQGRGWFMVLGSFEFIHVSPGALIFAKKSLEHAGAIDDQKTCWAELPRA
jgi:hypothetical protein